MKNNRCKTLLLLPLLAAAPVLPAQNAAGAATANPDFYNNLMAYGLILLAGMALIATLFALVSVLNAMVKTQQIRIYQEQGLEAYLEETKKKPAESLWRRLYKNLTRVVPVEKEKDILFDHDYDGIRELDNSLPPWWVYMFYITIAFGVIYMTYYHFSGVGPSSRELYEQEMKNAAERVQAYRALQAGNVDETTVEALTDEQDLALGKTVFETNCVACHGAMGEGGVGPNLTDEYWIHGGTIKDVFKTIKYGVPEKGMISWQSQLRPQDMQRVASFILTLQGTNPPNAKEPQGVKSDQIQSETPADTTQTLGMIGLDKATE